MFSSVIDKTRLGCVRGGGGLTVALFAALVVGLLLCTPAMALVQRGHVPSLSFGAKGSGEGQFNNPAGVAVSEVGSAAGDVYVVDRGNNRVEQFDAAGKFLAAWGWGVKTGAKEYEVCERGEGCQAGLPGTGAGKEKFHLGAGQLISPEGIAVDNSTSATDPSAGDVYVVASLVPEKSYVYKFGPNGQYIGHLTKKAETEEYGRVDGVSVDTQGSVWVAWRGEGAVTSFSGAEKNKRLTEEPYAPEDNVEMRPGFAVDSNDSLYLNFEPLQAFLREESVAYEETQFSEEGKGEHGEEPCEVALPCFAAKITTAESGERPVELGEAFIEGLFGETTTAIGTDLANNDVYVDHGSSIAAYTSSGTPIQRFGEGTLTRGSGIGVNSASGLIYVADAAAGDVQVFKPEGAGPAIVDGLSATKITTGAAELAAQIDPVGAETTVTFEYGTASCTEGGCTSTAAAPITVAGEAAANFEDQSRSVTLSGLVPGATYHYRVLAAHGSEVVTSAEHAFTTPPLALADSRAWEMVSPPAKNGVGIESLSRDGGVIEASEEGSALTFITTGPSEAGSEGNRSPAFTQNLATRVAGSEGKPEWSSKEIAIENPERAPGVAPGKEQEYEFFSPDLKLALLQPFGRFPRAEPKLSGEATEKTLYIRHNESCQPPPSSCYAPLVTASSDTAGTHFGGQSGVPNTGVRFLASTPDLSHVAITSEVPLTTQPAATGSNLYEFSERDKEGAALLPSEQLSLINVLPGGTTPAPNAGLGDWFRDYRNAISKDGSRIAWSTKEGVNSFPLHLYSRDMVAGETLQVDVPEAGAELGTSEAPIFQMASTDGTKIFFTDEQRLTTTSKSLDKAGEPDLYVYDTSLHKLTDLSVGTPGETANVRGLALGASEDGSIVYFVANGALGSTANQQGEKATPGSCGEQEQLEVPGASCNLYSEQYNSHTQTWKAPTFVARLSNLDLPDWGRTGRDDLGEVSSRVSPEGHYLSFMSQRPLTGYDNRATNPQANGARAEEVYLYNNETGHLTCASCNPSGARPNAVFDQEQSGEGLGLVVDRSEQWENHWLAGSIPGWTHSEGQQALYQSRYLSDKGRLFFNSADALAPADENGKEDVYEYEPSGEGSCTAEGGCVSLISSGTSAQESAFLDASLSGNDIFFLTSAQLAPADKDTNFDIYDARVCAEGSPCVTPPPPPAAPCESSSDCRPGSASVPVFAPPPSSVITGTGNLTPKSAVLPTKQTKPAPKLTRAQKLARALKNCRKLKQKHKRAACERSARKSYGPVKKTVKKVRR